MIVVAVDVTFGEGAIDAPGARTVIGGAVAETRKEPGCLRYVTSVDLENSSVVRFYEEWESLEALEAHFKTPHMVSFLGALGDLQMVSIEAKVYEVAKELQLPS